MVPNPVPTGISLGMHGSMAPEYYGEEDLSILVRRLSDFDFVDDIGANHALVVRRGLARRF